MIRVSMGLGDLGAVVGVAFTAGLLVGLVVGVVWWRR